MNANIFRHECRIRFKSVMVWSISLAVLIFFFFAMFPVFAEQAAVMNEFLAKYPPELRAAFGMNDTDLSSVLGFFSFIFMFVQLCLAIQASNYGVGLVSIEESELTADFLLSKPVSRSQVLASKFQAALASLTITNLVVWVVSFVAVALFRGDHEYDVGMLVLLLSSIIIFQLFYLSVGLLISLLAKRIRSVTPYGLGLAFGTYILSAFTGILGDVALEYLTPFKHFEASAIVNQGGFNTPLVLLNMAITVIALSISFWLYLRRDIPAVS